MLWHVHTCTQAQKKHFEGAAKGEGKIQKFSEKEEEIKPKKATETKVGKRF